MKKEAEAADEAVDRIVRLTERLVHYVNELIELSEANEVIAFSDVLTSQIPRSLAAHGFNQFVAVMLRFEIVRLAACWGRADDDDANIPSVIDALRREGVRRSAVSRNARDDPARADAYRSHLHKADALYTAVREDLRFSSIMSFRHKELAHNLKTSRLEKVTVVSPVTRQDAVWLLAQTEAIVQHLFHGLCASLFDFAMTRDQARLVAERLWCHCTFTDLR